MSQAIENKRRGRPKIVNEEELLRYEALWVETFCGLRSGAAETEGEIRGTSGTLMKVSGQEKLLIMSEQDRETVAVMFPGEAVRSVRQSKFMSTPEDIQSWRDQVQKEEEKFKRVTFGHETVTTKISAIPAERNLWEALKRAQTATQVRRICSRSRIWLKPRGNFPTAVASSGGFTDGRCTNTQTNFAERNSTPGTQPATLANRVTTEGLNI